MLRAAAALPSGGGIARTGRWREFNCGSVLDLDYLHGIHAAAGFSSLLPQASRQRGALARAPLLGRAACTPHPTLTDGDYVQTAGFDTKKARQWRAFFVLKPDDDLLSHGETPHYHRR